MKIRTELCDTEEIVIRCRERTEKIRTLESEIELLLRGDNEMALTVGGTEYFVRKTSILFFDSCNGRVYAHTANQMYTAPHKLFELENLLPSQFVRVSKSAIVNINHVASVRRSPVGNGELTFYECEKKVYFSRSYFKLLQYKINEMRFQK
ncbi:MAG: LytTR family transcriptional regulator DNA-binding domain-containing protein [Clostridia bacterium]|nr:LytTR family transcriptional regulator DNA-binding domain-containing protein [Clostridia bacterium]